MLAGFSTGNQLRCQVFTQNKIDCIICLGELTVTTITIPVTECGNYPKDYCLAKVKHTVSIQTLVSNLHIINTIKMQ